MSDSAVRLPPRRRVPRWRAWLALAGMTAGGMVATGAGVLATWVATTTATTATVESADLGLTHVDANGTSFSSSTSNLLPGDYLFRYAKLTNTGSVTADFTATVSGSGAVTDTGGLQVTVDKCSVAWATNGACAGTTTNLISTRDVNGAGQLTLDRIAEGGIDHLRYRFSLPASASSALQGASGDVTVVISATPTVPGGRDRSAG